MRAATSTGPFAAVYLGGFLMTAALVIPLVFLVRYATSPDGESCEFAIVVAEDWQHRGLARRLMGVLIETARDRGLHSMNGLFLSNNDRMLKFVQSLGFVLHNDPEDNTVKHGILTLQG